MTNEKIINGNNTIANFVGSRFIKDTFFPRLVDVEFELMDLDDLKFHSSWDWIMPAWRRLYLKLSESPYSFEIRIDEKPALEYWYTEMEQPLTKGLIDLAFKKLVEAIKWYNNNKQSKP